MESEQDPIRSYGLLGDAPVGEHYTRDGEDAANTDGLDRMAFVEVLAEAAVNTGDTLTIGVYGDWGEGKTSLMYLMKQVVDKNQNAIGVWFNAWQYEREDHLIVPLIATITRDINEALEKQKGKEDKLADTIVEGAKSLKNALRAIAYGFSFKGKVEVPSLAGAEVGLSGKDMIEQYQNLANDISLEKSLYFDAFEKLRAIKRSDQMLKIIVFIDDLDRCLPDAAVRLLENVKLVLNVPSFSFVLGIAPIIIQKFVERKFSTNLDLPESYFRNYLDKFIQVPVHLPRKNGDGFEAYIRKILEVQGVFDNREKNAFKNLISLIATISNHNPRSAVRTINRILVLNRIASRQNQEVSVTDLAFASVLQPYYSVFLEYNINFHLIYSGKSSMWIDPSLMHEIQTMEWPQGLPSSVKFSRGIAEILEFSKNQPDATSLASILRCLASIQNDPEVSDVLKWMADNKHICDALKEPEGIAWLRDRKKIEICFCLTDAIPASSDSVEKRVREQGEDPLQISENLIEIRKTGRIPYGVREFVTDLLPLRHFTHLRALDLNYCEKLIDLTPLTALHQLEILNLEGCLRVKNLEPLSNLTRLKQLILRFCSSVTNIEPLANLVQLENLDLVYCRFITDLRPLSHLTNLRKLNLRGCENVTDLTPLASLTKLESVELWNCGGTKDFKVFSNTEANLLAGPALQEFLSELRNKVTKP